MTDITCIDAAAALGDSNLVASWHRLIDRYGHPNAIYSSPGWLAHLRSADPTIETRVWIVRDGRHVVGVVPVLKRPYKLKFDIASRTFGAAKFKVSEVLGGLPLMRREEGLCARLYERIFESWPDCHGLYVDALPTDSACARVLNQLPRSVNSAYVYRPFGNRPWHLAELAGSFDDYMRSKSAKSRSTLRRKARRLEKLGPVRIRRFIDSSDASEFLSAAARVSRESWQGRRIGVRVSDDEAFQLRFKDLAARGLLRGYLLDCGDRPCAFVVGYQFRKVYHFAELGFDGGLARFSPGTLLTSRIIEDLHDHARLELINFGVGDATYKRRFGTLQTSSQAVLILRAALRNMLLTDSHRGFLSALEMVKRLMGRRVQN